MPCPFLAWLEFRGLISPAESRLSQTAEPSVESEPVAEAETENERAAPGLDVVPPVPEASFRSALREPDPSPEGVSRGEARWQALEARGEAGPWPEPAPGPTTAAAPTAPGEPFRAADPPQPQGVTDNWTSESGGYFVREPRPADGRGTNPEHPDWGAAGQQLLRLGDPSFTDDGTTLAGADRPGPRAISNALMQQHGDMPAENGISAFFWVWGQFLDHDLDLTPGGDTEAALIPVPAGDPFFDPHGTGTVTIPFFRVEPVNDPGPGEVRQYANEITAFIDASQVYGSSAETLALLRVEGGKIRLTGDGFLEQNGFSLLTGDVRAAENVALTSMHTIFAREHNRLVDELALRDPGLDDDQLFEAARTRVEVLLQAVTYNEFLPILLGPSALPEYAGFDPEVNPGISMEFSTAVFRLGHTLLSARIQRLEEDGAAHAGGHLSLRDAFFAPHLLHGGGLESILRGLGQESSQQLDPFIIEDVRSFLFGQPGAGGFDLAALNIQRGRDLGLPTYNGLREAVGLDPVSSFSEITSDPVVAAKLEAIYGDVSLVDAWVGGLAEDPLDEGMVGETFAGVLVDQFTRLRAGDPYWGGGKLPPHEVEALMSTRLSDIIARNTDIDHVQRDVFHAYDRIGGTDRPDKLVGDDDRDLLLGFGGSDRLYGGPGDDELVGGGGPDHLVGGPGNNLLFGGGGPDRFVFDATEPGHSIIADFEVEIDRLVLRNVNRDELSIETQEDQLTLVLSPDTSVTLENIDPDSFVLGNLVV